MKEEFGMKDLLYLQQKNLNSQEAIGRHLRTKKCPQQFSQHAMSGCLFVADLPRGEPMHVPPFRQ